MGCCILGVAVKWDSRVVMKILHQQLVINCDCVIVVLRQVYLKTFQIDYCKNYLSEQ